MACFRSLGSLYGGGDDDDDKEKNRLNADERKKSESFEGDEGKEEEVFREYCVADLSAARKGERGIGLRWRTKRDVLRGKGTSICAALDCESVNGLKSYEVDFRYNENGIDKRTLVKVRLCSLCAIAAGWKRSHKDDDDDDKDDDKDKNKDDHHHKHKHHKHDKHKHKHHHHHHHKDEKLEPLKKKHKSEDDKSSSSLIMIEDDDE